MREYCSENVKERYCLNSNFVKDDGCGECPYLSATTPRIMRIKARGNKRSNIGLKNLRLDGFVSASSVVRESVERIALEDSYALNLRKGRGR